MARATEPSVTYRCECGLWRCVVWAGTGEHRESVQQCACGVVTVARPDGTTERRGK